MTFKNRNQAGLLLVQKLAPIVTPHTVVIGLARGGMVTASAVAREFHIPIDVLAVKKIATREDPELAIGAIAPDGILYVDWKFAHRLGFDEDRVNKELAPVPLALIHERMLRYRKGKRPLKVQGKTALLVDDGAATGATMQAAVAWAKKKHAEKIMVAVPVAPPSFYQSIRPDVDEVIVLETPSDFRAVGQFYEDFPQVSDEEVIELLGKKRGEM